MIGAVNEPQDQPLVLIPVMADDVAREKRRRWTIGIGVGMAVLLAGGYIYKRTSDPRSAREAYDAGVRLMKATRYDQASLNFTRAIDLQANFLEAYRMRARVAVAEYAPDPAIRDFSKVIQFDPRDASALVERGFAELEKKDNGGAVADADRALALDPAMARAYNLRATARRAAGDTGKALADFTKAVQLEPDLNNYLQRATTYQLMNRHQLAIADFDNAIYYDPQQPHVYYARALSKAALGDAPGAKTDIEAGRKIDGW